MYVCIVNNLIIISLGLDVDVCIDVLGTHTHLLVRRGSEQESGGRVLLSRRRERRATNVTAAWHVHSPSDRAQRLARIECPRRSTSTLGRYGARETPHAVRHTRRARALRWRSTALLPPQGLRTRCVCVHSGALASVLHAGRTAPERRQLNDRGGRECEGRRAHRELRRLPADVHGWRGPECCCRQRSRLRLRRAVACSQRVALKASRQRDAQREGRAAGCIWLRWLLSLPIRTRWLARTFDYARARSAFGGRRRRRQRPLRLLGARRRLDCAWRLLTQLQKEVLLGYDFLGLEHDGRVRTAVLQAQLLAVDGALGASRPAAAPPTAVLHALVARATRAPVAALLHAAASPAVRAGSTGAESGERRAVVGGVSGVGG